MSKTLQDMVSDAMAKASDLKAKADALAKQAKGKPEDSEEMLQAMAAEKEAADAWLHASDLKAAADQAAADVAQAQAQAQAQANADESDPKPSKAEVTMERQIDRQEAALKKQLAKRPKKTIHIPEDPLNPDDVVPVGWNGIIYAIPRGKDFDVPDVIYDIWKESYDKTAAVNRRIRESVNKEIKILHE